MNIWIDLANSPHVIFFHPLISRFKEKGHQVFVTIRDFAQTVSLSKKYGIDGVVIDKHGGAGYLSKFINLCTRTSHLIEYSKGKSIDLFVSHGSYTHITTGRLLRKKVVTIMDYEGQAANHYAFRLAHKVIVPEFFPDKALKRFGAKTRNVIKYNGFKEQLYLSDFVPDPTFLSELAESCQTESVSDLEKKVIVTVRTPATMAVYHQFENPVFDKLLHQLNSRSDSFSVILPRTNEQGIKIKENFPNLFIPDRALDGRNLAYFSDLVISAGGTMNREAAILGTPAYSLFLGAFPEVDKKLISMERMYHISNENNLSDIRFEKKSNNADRILRNNGLIDDMVHYILS